MRSERANEMKQPIENSGKNIAHKWGEEMDDLYDDIIQGGP